MKKTLFGGAAISPDGVFCLGTNCHQQKEKRMRDITLELSIDKQMDQDGEVELEVFSNATSIDKAEAVIIIDHLRNVFGIER